MKIQARRHANCSQQQGRREQYRCDHFPGSSPGRPQTDAGEGDQGDLALDVINSLKIRRNEPVAKVPGGGLDRDDSLFRRTVEPRGLNAALLKGLLRGHFDFESHVGAGQAKIDHVQLI